jgi:hypothetical protein
MNMRERQKLRAAESRYAKACYKAILAQLHPLGFTPGLFDTVEGTRDNWPIVRARQLIMGLLTDMGIRGVMITQLLNRQAVAVQGGVTEYRKRRNFAAYAIFADTIIKEVLAGPLPPKPLLTEDGETTRRCPDTPDLPLGALQEQGDQALMTEAA